VIKFLGLQQTTRALAHRNFALFFIGQGLSLSGTWMQSLAQSWLVYRLTGSPFLLGLVAFASQAPVLGLGLFGGVLADRWPRHRLLLLTQSLSLLQAATLTVLTLTGGITVHWILALAAVLGVINAIDMPVRQSFIAELVPRQDLPSAIGLNSSAFNAARIIGPSLAGVLVATVGEGVCFLINTLSFLAVIGCLLAMRLPPRPQPALESPATLLAKGLRYARETPHVRAILALIAGLSITAMPYTVLLPVFAGEVLHSSAKGLGALMAATGVGALAGALRIARRATIRGLGTLIVQSVVIFGASLVALAAGKTMWLSMLVLFAAGYGMISAMAGCNTLLQSLVPDELRGRVMSLYTMFFLGMAPIGSLIAGVLATHVGTPITFLVGGVGALLSAVLFHHALPAIRRHIREHGLLPPEELIPH
jgi:MFS family permease